MVRREGGQFAVDRRAGRTAAAGHARGLLLSTRPGDHSRDRPVRREGAGQPRLLSQQALWCRLVRRAPGRLLGPRTRDGRDHVISLSEPSLAILDSVDVSAGALVFGEQGRAGYSGWSK